MKILTPIIMLHSNNWPLTLPGMRYQRPQISMAVMEDLVIFVQERPSPCLKAVEKRVEAGRGKIRTAGPGYLAYALIDAVVDNSLDVIGQIAETVESVERDMLEDLNPDHLEQIHRLETRGDIFQQAASAGTRGHSGFNKIRITACPK